MDYFVQDAHIAAEVFLYMPANLKIVCSLRDIWF